ncbi:MAG: UPF0280 family protein, partial [Silicimonas sp.]|nr:UPF0280 family protein [Silicimonas sp.]
MQGAVAKRLSVGRLHLQHGPIDLIVTADGEREAAFDAAERRFRAILGELVSELPGLRRPITGTDFHSPVARRMADAVRPHHDHAFITPMAAVAGAVADEVLAAMTGLTHLSRAAVNNGGDIALHLDPGRRFRLAMASHANSDLGRIEIVGGQGVGGIATSGRHGRSLSLGIADSVTVMAATAAAADAAATLIANAVDLPGHPAILRTPASTLDPDSDLGGRLVVTGCGPITRHEIEIALDAGERTARSMVSHGLIAGAALFLDGQSRTLDTHAH